MADNTLTEDDKRVIRERHHGWERASCKLLADVFGVTPQRISAIINTDTNTGGKHG